MSDLLETFRSTTWLSRVALLFVLLVVAHTSLLLLLHYIAPKPRAPLASEKTYLTSTADSKSPQTYTLPCWFDRWLAERQASEARTRLTDPRLAGAIPDTGSIEPATVRVSVIFPAYNEEDRVLPTLEEAIQYLDESIGRPTFGTASGTHKAKNPVATCSHIQDVSSVAATGYEIIVVDDGSQDRTIEVCLDFAKNKGLHDILRVVKLEKNRGKGGAVTHGMRHARGEYVLFADADGASKFSDIGRLIQACEKIVDGSHRGVAIGSRAHLVGSEAVVKRSALRNFLMRSFHLVLMILTPPATSRLRDTQCGFKLFTRAALPHIVPYMHAEGWIFDIEMLLLAESAPPAPVVDADGTVIGSSPGIHVVEVPIDWHEVAGSKMSLVSDSIRMAVGLAVLRASWMMGVYRRRMT